MLTKKQRVTLILHLCLVFTLLIQSLLIPCVDRYFQRKADQHMFQIIFNSKLETATTRLFDDLPHERANHILQVYKNWQLQVEPSLMEQIREAFIYLNSATSIYFRLWLVISVIGCLFLLFQIEGSKPIIWIAPCLVLLMGQSQYQQSSKIHEKFDTKLWPNEQEVIQIGLNRPLSRSIKLQKEELNLAWQRYLILQFNQEEPSVDPLQFHNQLKRAEFLFQTARFDLMQKGNVMSFKWWIIQGPSFLVLCIYLGWNIYFAWTISYMAKGLSDARAV